MARSYGNSVSDDPQDAIDRALRAARSRAPSNEGPRAVPMWNEYQADREPYGNRPWRPTPYQPRQSDIDDVASELGVSKKDAESIIKAVAQQGFGSTTNDWMAPGLQQYAALNAAIAQAPTLRDIAKTFDKVGKPETWTREPETERETTEPADVERGPVDDVGFTDVPGTMLGIAEPGYDLGAPMADDQASLMDDARALAGLDFAGVPSAVASALSNPNAYAAQTIGVPAPSLYDEAPEAPDEPNEAPGFAAPSFPSEFSGRATAAEQAAREQAAYEQALAEEQESQLANDLQSMQAAPNTRSAYEAERAAERAAGLREVSIPGFIAERLGLNPSLPSWAVNREVDDFMSRPAINPDEFDVPAPALDQAIAANIASMTGRTPSSVIAGLPNVEEAIAAAVEDDMANVQAANMEMADIEESQAQALAAMQAFAAQNALAMEQGLPSLSYAPQAPAFSQVETPSLSYNPQSPAFDMPTTLGPVGLYAEPQAMPSYYAPMSLPAVEQREEPQAMNLYAPIETPALSYAPTPQAVMQSIYAEEAARAMELGRQMQEEVDKIGQELGQPTPTPTISQPGLNPQGIANVERNLTFTVPTPKSFLEPEDVTRSYQSRNRRGIDDEAVVDDLMSPVVPAAPMPPEETAPAMPETPQNIDVPANPFSAPLGTMPSMPSTEESEDETAPANEMEDLNNAFQTSFVASAPTFSGGLMGMAGIGPAAIAGMLSTEEGLAALGLDQTGPAFGDLGIGQSAVDTAQGQMASLGLQGLFDQGFSNPLGYSSYGIEGQAPSAEAESDDQTSGPSPGFGPSDIGSVDTSPGSSTDGPGESSSSDSSGGSASSGDSGGGGGTGGPGDGTGGMNGGFDGGGGWGGGFDGGTTGSGPGDDTGGMNGGFDGGGGWGGGFDGSSSMGGAGWASGGYVAPDRAILRAILAAERLHDRDRKARGGYVMPFARFANGGEIVENSVEYTPNGVIYSQVVQRALSAAKRRNAA